MPILARVPQCPFGLTVRLRPRQENSTCASGFGRGFARRLLSWLLRVAPTHGCPTEGKAWNMDRAQLLPACGLQGSQLVPVLPEHVWASGWNCERCRAPNTLANGHCTQCRLPFVAALRQSMAGNIAARLAATSAGGPGAQAWHTPRACASGWVHATCSSPGAGAAERTWPEDGTGLHGRPQNRCETRCLTWGAHRLPIPPPPPPCRPCCPLPERPAGKFPGPPWTSAERSLPGEQNGSDTLGQGVSPPAPPQVVTEDHRSRQDLWAENTATSGSTEQRCLPAPGGPPAAEGESGVVSAAGSKSLWQAVPHDFLEEVDGLENQWDFRCETDQLLHELEASTEHVQYRLMQQFRETQGLHKEAREELREAQKNLTEARRAFRSALETDATREREFQRARRELTEAFLPSHAPEVAGLYTSTMRRILSALRARNAQQLLLSAELAKAVLDRSAPLCESSESDAVETASTSCLDPEGADILTAGCNAESDDRSDLGAMSRLQGQQLYRDRSRSPRCANHL